MNSQFTNKVVLVTGAGFKIGEATAIAFAKRGAKVIMADKDENHGALDHTYSFMGEAVFVQSDASKESNIKTLIKDSIAQYGQIDYAINYAGFEESLLRTPGYKKEIQETLTSKSLKSLWFCMKHQLPLMLKQKSGVIVNCSPKLGMDELNCLAAYTAAGYGVKAQLMERGYQQSGVRINALSTKFTKRIKKRVLSSKMQYSSTHSDQRYATKRFDKSGAISEKVIFLCSDGAISISDHLNIMKEGLVLA